VCDDFGFLFEVFRLVGNLCFAGGLWYFECFVFFGILLYFVCCLSAFGDLKCLVLYNTVFGCLGVLV